jgi:anti-sigma regulatory factor (Ser/Thr protein kinase)
VRLDSPIRLEIPSNPAVLFLVRAMVKRLAERLGFSDDQVQRMILAIDEACTNVIRHAYRNRPGERMVISFLIDPKQLEIQIRDFGQAALPEALQPRDLSQVRPGGLGLHFIREGMDEVHYETPQDGGGLLRLIRYRPQPRILR